MVTLSCYPYIVCPQMNVSLYSEVRALASRFIYVVLLTCITRVGKRRGSFGQTAWAVSYFSAAQAPKFTMLSSTDHVEIIDNNL